MRARGPALVALALLAAPACAPEESSVGGVFDAQPGLTAEYFDGTSFERPSGVYRDPNIDFEGWELNERVQSRGHADHTLSIRWTGQLWLEHDEAYTISFELRGRVRLWIDDALVIDDWTDSRSLRQPRGTVRAAGAGWRDLRVEWDQVDGPMTARLRTRSASQPEAVVPARALRSLDTLHADDASRLEALTWEPSDIAPELQLTGVMGLALSSDGLVAAGVSVDTERFWEAWVVPFGGGAPRRLAPIGDTLLSVDASGVVWTTMTSVDERGTPSHETRRSPADGSPSILLSRD